MINIYLNTFATSPLKDIVIPNEVVMDKIYMIRDQKVMLDEELSELYGVESQINNLYYERMVMTSQSRASSIWDNFPGPERT